MDKQKTKGGEKKGRIKGLLLLVACLTVCVFALAACGGQPQSSSSDAAAVDGGSTQAEADNGSTANSGSGTGSSLAMMSDFTDRGNGLFAEDEWADTFINSSNRGCNSCHGDLWELMRKVEPGHIVTNAGYEKDGDILACLSCHSAQVGRGGVYLGDVLHSAHYSSAMFNEGNGNCWSCHAINSTATGTYALGNYEMLLFEQMLYTDSLGGYPDGSDEHTRAWVKSRGWPTEYLSGATSTDSLNAKIELSQPTSAEEDIYIVENWGPVDDMADWDNWALEIVGANSPRSFTLDELNALPQTEVTATQVCTVNGVNGGLVSNIPAKGVLLSDVIEAAGGLGEGYDQMYPQGVDGWTGEGFGGISVQDMLDRGTIVATQYYGHELTFGEGYPCLLVVPGYGGSTWCKSLMSIEFKKEAAFNPMNGYLDSPGLAVTVNSAWFENDGVAAKVGQPVTLDGYSWTWDALHKGGVGKISFSADYGNNWQTVDVPESFDPSQWAYWTFTWTPDAPGTYVLHVTSEARDGSPQFENASVIVKVTE